MNVVVRLRRDLFAMLIEDLRRPHRLAYERVGWVFAKQAHASHSVILLADGYEPVDDADYVEDESVGARFNTVAIRKALQRARSTTHCCLQVHLHDHGGRTDFSGIDRKTIDELARSFRSLVPVAHGGLVLSRDNASARVWLPENDHPSCANVVIVGFPITIGPLHQ